MDQESLQHAEKWAANTFGAAELGDPRRTDRLIKVASALASNPSASLPHALETWGETLGAYRFLENPAISYEQIVSPRLLPDLLRSDPGSSHVALGRHHRDGLLETQGRQRIRADWQLKGGPRFQRAHGASNESADPAPVGVYHPGTLPAQTGPPSGETKAQRKKRERESQVWERSVKQMGRVPQNQQWIYVGDSGSDIYTFWQTCEDLGYDFAVRVAQDRVIQISPADVPEDCHENCLKTLARALPATAARFLSIPAHERRPKREVFLQMSFQKVRVQPPLHGDSLRKTEITAWVLRVWETHPPEGQEPLEWILLTTIPLLCPADAWEVVQWYRWRWLLEDFHKALKTGCRLEQRYVQSVESLWKLLAILTPIALRLLLIRQAAQQVEELPATQVVSQEVIRIVIGLDQRHRDISTAKQLWHAIARLGGYLDRTCDGPPGWQTLWKGWMRVMYTFEGVHLAAHFSSP